MTITIDNHDGLGSIDYTAALSDRVEWKILRKLNEPTECIFGIDCNAARFAPPVKYGRVVVSADAGTLLFTGYIVQVPVGQFQGTGLSGALYALLVTAISDEVLLDQQSVPVTSGNTGLRMAISMQALTQRVDPLRLTVAADDSTNIVGRYSPDAAHTWSANARELALLSRASYRTLSGQVMLQQIGTITHTLNDSDGTLDPGTLALASVRQLVNDVTVCGEDEPQAYVTDVFQGDGITTAFQLTRTPIHIPAAARILLFDTFNGPAINSLVWDINDPGARFSLNASGLSVNGGNGVDGQTTLLAIDNTELGGALVLTAGGVQVSGASDGYIACLYSGDPLLQNLFAGFHVKQSSGNTVVVPVVAGVETGSTAPLVSGHAYSFRLRFHSREMLRVLNSYYVTAPAGQAVFGGNLIEAVADLVFEVQDTTAGINQPTVVLYDGSVNTSPKTCVLAIVNSPAFTGSVQSVSLDQSGSAWVKSLETGGNAFTRRLGAATAGADCTLGTTGKLTFYPTSIPQSGETISVSYRTSGVSVARLCNQASIAAEATALIPGVSRWIGSVSKPAPRSSADCENAALALLAVSTDASAGRAGRYVGQNLQQFGDIWPGDVLALQSETAALNARVIVRSVTMASALSVPELITYTIEFANDWALDLSIKTSAAVPKTAWLPQTALAAPTALANLVDLKVVVSASQIAVTAGLAAPSGGGFEVRRIDWHFGSGSGDGTLVLRSPVPNFTILRESAIEQYFVRMYDGATPPNYSRFSSEICVSVPM